jgi:group I intron endonuclease
MKNKITGIYKIINKTNGKYYIGSSKNITKRFWTHRTLLNRQKHENVYLQRAWNKYGKDNFEFSIIEILEEENLLKIEQKYLDIAMLERNKSYNLNFGAFRVKHAPETIEKLRRINMGKNNPRFGVSPSQYTRNLVSNIHKNSGKFAGTNNPMFGKKHNEKTIEKIRRAGLGRPYTGKKNFGKNHFNHDPKVYKFYNKDTKEKFSGLKSDFIRLYKLNRGEIYKLINGERKRVKSWIIHNPLYSP